VLVVGATSGNHARLMVGPSQSWEIEILQTWELPTASNRLLKGLEDGCGSLA
jgi:hypothetical protein